jgi:hypothetical protein
VSKLETLRQAVISADLKMTRAAETLREARLIAEEAKEAFNVAFDLLQTAQRELTEATRGTEVAL